MDPFSPENKDDIKRLKNLQTKLHEHFISFINIKKKEKKLDLKNKLVLVRVDLNLPVINGVVQDETRLQSVFTDYSRNY